MDQHIQVSCGLCYKEETPKSLDEDNATYIAQLKGRYIKGNGMKYIFSKVLLHRWFLKQVAIDVQQMRWSDCLAYLVTKLLPTFSFHKLV